MFRKTILDLKNLRWFLLVPVVPMLLILPLLNWYALSVFAPEQAAGNIFRDVQITMPLMAAFPIIFLLRPLIENPGHEVLYTFRRIKNLNFITVLLVFLLHLVLMTPTFMFYSTLYEGVAYEFFRTAVQSFFFCSLAYAVTYLVKSTLAAFLATLILGAGMLLPMQDMLINPQLLRTVNVFSFIHYLNPRPVEFPKYLLVLALSVLFFFIGILSNRKHFQ